MKKTVNTRGMTLIELLIASLLALIVASGLLVLIQTTYTAQDTLFGQNAAYSRVRLAIDRISDNVRSAQLFPNSNVAGQAIKDAGIFNGYPYLQFYTDSSGGNTTKYWLDINASPMTLKKELYSTSTGSDTIYDMVYNVTALTYTFYTQSATSFNSNTTSWPTTADPQRPTSAEYANIGAVKIALTVNLDGNVRTLTSLVRLRNSPYKAHL